MQHFLKEVVAIVMAPTMKDDPKEKAPTPLVLALYSLLFITPHVILTKTYVTT